jgi:hypothetical protein
MFRHLIIPVGRMRLGRVMLRVGVVVDNDVATCLATVMVNLNVMDLLRWFRLLGPTHRMFYRTCPLTHHVTFRKTSSNSSQCILAN